jgi:hypothetical protein
VYQLNTQSSTWTEKGSIGPLSMLISSSCSKAIIPSGPKIKSGHIYFLDHFCPQFLPADGQHFSYRAQIFNLATGAVTEQLIGRDRATRLPGYPMWFFPMG